MTFREQFVAQKAHAEMLRDFCGIRGLFLVANKARGIPAVVSIIGSAIVPCMPEIWRAQGHFVHNLCDL